MIAWVRSAWRRAGDLAGWLYGEVIYPLWLTFGPVRGNVPADQEKGKGE